MSYVGSVHRQIPHKPCESRENSHQEFTENLRKHFGS